VAAREVPGEEAVHPWQRWTMLGNPLDDEEAIAFNPETGQLQPWSQLEPEQNQNCLFVCFCCLCFTLFVFLFFLI